MAMCTAAHLRCRLREAFMSKRVSNQDRRHASTEAVLRAARELFVEQGYEHTSISRIAARAGLTKGAVYFYFKDKAELLQRLLDEANEVSFQSIIAAMDAQAGSPRKQLLSFVNTTAAVGVENREHMLLPVLMAVEFAASDQQVARKVREIYAAWTAALESVVRAGQSTGDVDATLDPESTAIALVALVDGLLLQWHRLHQEIDGPRLARTARAMVMNAVGAVGAR